MKTVGIIPARLASRRLKNKVLKPILGRPLLWHTWQKARQASFLDRVIIACCDEEVKKEAQNFGAEVFWTSPEHRSGTDRIAEVASKIDCDIVLNIQADEPLIKPGTLEDIARFLIDNPDQFMVSIAFAGIQKEQTEDPNVVKVVVDKHSNALYFSRGLIPFCLKDNAEEVRYLKHIGIYGYRKDFLLNFSRMKQTYLEKIERLEQLRALENAVKLKILKIDYDTIGIDTGEDFKKAEEKLAQNRMHR